MESSSLFEVYRECDEERSSEDAMGGEGRVGIKKPTQKNPPKKPKKTHLKKTTKSGFFGFF
jgi:hypothetical protein